MAFEFDDATKLAIRHRQRGVCALCGDTSIVNFHHIVPRQSGDPTNPAQAWLATAENGVGLCDIDHKAVHIGEDPQLKVRYATSAVPPAEYFEFAHGKPPNSDPVKQKLWAQQHEAKAQAVWRDLEWRMGNAEAIRKALLAQAAQTAASIKRTIDQLKGEHELQQKLITSLDTSSPSKIAIGVIGYATTEFFAKLPPLSIWLKAEALLSSARISITDGNIARATADLTMARFNMMLAAARFLRWKDALHGTKESMGAGSKMQLAIVGSAILLVAVTFGAMAAAPATIQFIRGLVTVLSSSQATPIVRLAATVQEAEQVFARVETSIEALEATVEAVEEAALRTL